MSGHKPWGEIKHKREERMSADPRKLAEEWFAVENCAGVATADLARELLAALDREAELLAWQDNVCAESVRAANAAEAAEARADAAEKALKGTCDSPPLLALHNLRLTADEDSLWIEASNGAPLTTEQGRITFCLLTGFSKDRTMFAFGSRECLRKTSALVKVVVEGEALAAHGKGEA